MNVTVAVKEKKKTADPQSSSGRRRFCGGFNDCLIMGSTVSHPPTTRLEHLVGELEREVQKHKEVGRLSRLRLERTQDYLRYCLQVAQENGFLENIINNNKRLIEQSSTDNDLQRVGDQLLSATIIHQVTASPSTPPRQVHQQHPDLAALAAQARLNGWYIEPHEIELLEKVAEGSTADVYRATWRGFDVAVKCIFPDFFHSNEYGVSFFAQEVETLSRQRHRHVLQLMGACLNPPEEGWVVTEFLSTTLKNWLHGVGSRRKKRTTVIPPLEERLSIAIETSQAMQYLHEHNPKVIHRDLKLSNIFLDENGHVRVADFGHARLLTDEEKALTGETGTYIYMAPEVIRCQPYDEKCDVYSFGIILNELITGDHPYIETDYNPTRIAMEVAESGLRPALAKERSINNGGYQVKEINELVQLLWDEDDARRPSFSTITTTLKAIRNGLVESPYFDYDI